MPESAGNLETRHRLPSPPYKGAWNYILREDHSLWYRHSENPQGSWTLWEREHPKIFLFIVALGADGRMIAHAVSERGKRLALQMSDNLSELSFYLSNVRANSYKAEYDDRYIIVDLLSIGEGWQNIPEVNTELAAALSWAPAFDPTAPMTQGRPNGWLESEGQAPQ